MILLREKALGKSFCSVEPITMSLLAGGAMNMGGSIFGGLFGAGASRRRARALLEAGEVAATDVVRYMRGANKIAREYGDIARADLSPFREVGVRAGNTLADMLMGGGDMSALLKASPLFNFQSELGMRNINRELAARGLYGSGAGLESLARFNNQLVAEEGQRFTDRLFNLTNLGATTASNLADVALRTGGLMSNNMFNAGNAAANFRFIARTGAAGANAEATRTLGSMGQSLFNTVGGGLMQYGNYQLQKPLFDSLVNNNNGMTGARSSAGKRYSFTGETGLEGLANFSMAG